MEVYILKKYPQIFGLSAHCPNALKMFLMVPINVSSHDLQENHFANTKLVNVTVTIE